MASDYGISTEGFRKKRLSDIKTEVEDTLKTLLGNNINLLPSSVLANLTGVYSDRESLLWELAEQVYNSQYLNSADGINLDNVMTLLGVTRLPQTKSLQKALHLFGDVGTLVPAGTKVSVVGSPTSVFETVSATTLVAGTDEVQTLSFFAVPVAGSFRLKYLDQETGILNFNATDVQIQTALNALSKLEGITVVGNFAGGFVITFAGDSGKINHDLLLVTSNTLAVVATVAQTTAGVPQGTTDALCTAFGPVVAPAFTLSNIDTPVVGLNRTTNPTDATIGRNTETDSELRVRSIIGQKSRGASTVEAIRARLLEVSGVTQAIVFQNETMLVNADGLPPKSFRPYVQGGLDADIFQAVWLSKPAGIQSDGTVTGTITDSQGLTQNIAFERPVVKPVYITVEISRDVAKFPANGATLVRSALATFINALEIGSDVIVYPSLIASLDSIVGINDVEIGVGFAAAPPLGQDANLSIAINEIAKIVNQNTDIVVTVV